MPERTFNKFRAAIEILQHGRDVLVENLADEILDQGFELTESGYQFHELLESQGTRLHFLSLLINQLEQSAEALDETSVPPVSLPPPPPQKAPVKRRSRSKKIQQQTSTKGSTDDV